MSHILTDYLIDTHCHPNFKAFEGEEEDAVKRAFEAGVRKLIVPGSNLETSRKAVEMAKRFEGVYAAVGVHPTHTDRVESREEKEKILSEIRELSRENKVVAIGEVGLDYHREPYHKERQIEFLRDFIEIAKEIEKPIILHSWESSDDLYGELVKMEKLKGVLHCFIDDSKTAKKFLDLGLYIGFTGKITYEENEELQRVVEAVPLEKLLVETDSPYIAPGERRGQRNEPAYVVEVAKCVAEIKKISFEEVRRQTTQNAVDLFGLK